MNDPLIDGTFALVILIFIAVLLNAQATQKGVQDFMDKLLDPRIDTFIAWGKKTWYTRLIYVCLLPFSITLLLISMVVILAPICNLLEILWQFPGKTIYWIANGKYPEHSSLFHKWEKKG